MSGKLTRNGITIRRGDSFNIVMQFKAANENFDLTNSEIRMSVRNPQNGKLLFPDKKAELINAKEGKSRLCITAQDTSVTPGEYETDIQIILPNGDVHTIYPQDLCKPAYFVITPDVTS